MIAGAYRFLVRLIVNLKFAVGLLIVIAVASIAGTLIGASRGEEAQAAFFKSAPFSALMILFMFSLILAVVSRYPWKRTQIGWIITHAGLVVIVVGHMITARHGINGRVDLHEGQSTDEVEGKRWLLLVDLLDRNERVKIPFGLDAPPDVPLDRTFALPNGETLRIESYSPNLVMRRRVEPDFSSPEPLNPALRLELSQVDRTKPATGAAGERRNTKSEWLFADVPGEAAKTFGNAFTTIYRRFEDRAALTAFLEAPASGVRGSALSFSAPGRAPIIMPVGEAGAGHRPIDDTGYTVAVLQRFERLRVDSSTNRAFEAKEGPLMQAVQIEIGTPAGGKDVRWLFVQAPELDTPGRTTLPFTPRFLGDASAVNAEFPPSSLVVLEAPGAPALRALVDPRGGREVEPLVVGERFEIPWFDGVEAEIADIYHRTRVVEEPWTASYVAARPALRVTLEGADGRETQWVRWNSTRTPTRFRGGAVAMRYGPETFPLNFTITLKDFVLKKYEGTNNPRSFESFVRVRPKDGEPAFDYHIYMNNVMDWDGWRFFQSNYNPQDLTWSSFTASYDPGRGTVYAGYLLTTLGLLFIVFVKPWLVKREALRLAAAGLARAQARRGAAVGSEKAESQAAEVGA